MSQNGAQSSDAIAMWVQDQLVPGGGGSSDPPVVIASSSSQPSSEDFGTEPPMMPHCSTSVFIEAEQHAAPGSDITEPQSTAPEEEEVATSTAGAGEAAAYFSPTRMTPQSSTESPSKPQVSSVSSIPQRRHGSADSILKDFSSAQKKRKQAGLLLGVTTGVTRKPSDAAEAAEGTTSSSTSSVEDILCGGRIPYEVVSSVDTYVVKPLLPTIRSLQLRHRAIQEVCQSITHCMRFNGFMWEVRYFVFGSVNLRTVLPDGDIDITLVIDDAPPHGAQELLPKLRDSLNQMNQHILIDQLVFAEVRVLKLVYDGFSIDVTVGQKGGLGTACFLHEVDDRIGFHHLFKKSLTLIKAWCNYEARILGATGGYLGTYAVTVMLMCLLNEVPFHLLRNDPNSCASPFRVLVKFLDYVSSFDFDNFCMTIHGPVPVSFMAASTASLPYGGYVFPPRKEIVDESFVDDVLLRYSLHHSMAPVSNETTPVGANNSNPRTTPTTSHLGVSAFPATPVSISSLGGGGGGTNGTTPQISPTNTPRLSPVPGNNSAGSGVMPSGGFPLRNMNVSDPLRPASNLTRGVCRNHQGRIRNAMLHGLAMMSRLIKRVDDGEADASLFLREVFPETEVVLHSAAVGLHQRSSQQLPSVTGGGGNSISQLLQCTNCIQPSIFCADVSLLSQPVFVELASSRPPGIAKQSHHNHVSDGHHHHHHHNQQQHQQHHVDPSGVPKRPFATHATIERQQQHHQQQQQQPISPPGEDAQHHGSTQRNPYRRGMNRNGQMNRGRGGASSRGGSGETPPGPTLASMDFPPLP